MAISTKSLYSDLLSLLNKNNSEYISPEEFVRILEMSSDDLYNDYLGNRNVRRSVFGHNSITDRRLNPFKKTSPLIGYNPANKQIPIPEDCKHIRSVVAEDGTPLIYQDDNRFNMLSRDSTVDIDREIYYKEEREGDKDYLEVLTRKSVGNVKVNYLKVPDKPKMPYTIVDREIVITDAQVVDLEWDSDQTSSILNRLLVYAGISLRDNTAIQIGKTNKSEE